MSEEKVEIAPGDEASAVATSTVFLRTGIRCGVEWSGPRAGGGVYRGPAPAVVLDEQFREAFEDFPDRVGNSRVERAPC